MDVHYQENPLTEGHSLPFQVSVSELRIQCGDYIREHSTNFLPYLTHSETGNQFTQGSQITVLSVTLP